MDRSFSAHQSQVKAVKDPRLTIDVDNLPAEGWTFHDEIPAADVTSLLNREGGTDLEALAPLDADLKAYKIGDGLRVEGTATVHLARPCGRCTQPAPLTVALKLNQTLFPSKKAPARADDAEEVAAESPRKGKKGKRGKKKEEEPVDFTASWDVEDVDTGVFEAGKADVQDILREQILLEVPFTSVCQEDCKGLCQTCGADLNRGACDCSPLPKNPKLAALANIKLQ